MSIAAHVAALTSGNEQEKAHAARALRNLTSQDGSNDAAIREAGGIAPLVELVRSGTEEQKTKGAGALWNLAKDATNKRAIREANGIAPLVALVGSGTEDQKTKCAGALLSLAIDVINKTAIRETGGIVPLVALVSCGTDEQMVKGAGALRNLAVDAANKVAIREGGGIAPLVALVSHGNSEQKTKGAGALSSLAIDANNQLAIYEAGGIVPLVALMSSGTSEQKKEATRAMAYLAADATNQRAIREAGGIAPLAALVFDGTDEQRASAAGALAYLAIDATNSVAIREAGCIAPLIALAGTSAEVKELSEGTLLLLSLDPQSRDIITSSFAGFNVDGVLEQIVALARDGTLWQKTFAATSIVILACNLAHGAALLQAKAVAVFAALVNDPVATDHQKCVAERAVAQLKKTATDHLRNAMTEDNAQALSTSLVMAQEAGVEPSLLKRSLVEGMPAAAHAEALNQLHEAHAALETTLQQERGERAVMEQVARRELAAAEQAVADAHAALEQERHKRAAERTAAAQNLEAARAEAAAAEQKGLEAREATQMEATAAAEAAVAARGAAEQGKDEAIAATREAARRETEALVASKVEEVAHDLATARTEAAAAEQRAVQAEQAAANADATLQQERQEHAVALTAAVGQAVAEAQATLRDETQKVQAIATHARNQVAEYRRQLLEMNRRLLKAMTQTLALSPDAQLALAEPPRFVAAVNDFVTGQAQHAARGMAYYLCVDEDELMTKMVTGVEAIRGEFAAHVQALRAQACDSTCTDEEAAQLRERADEDEQCVAYVLDQEAGTLARLFPNGDLMMDCDDDGSLLPERRNTATGRGMVLSDFVNHDDARDAGLKAANVAALRLYTSPAYKSINEPLRDKQRFSDGRPHPLAVTVAILSNATKKLRSISATRPQANESRPLYRGMSDVIIPDEFVANGGTELAPMSATFDLDTAVNFATGGQLATVMRIHNTNWTSRGADVRFLSCFPAEEESLFPPLTYMECRPDADAAPPVTTASGVVFSVIDIEAKQLA